MTRREFAASALASQAPVHVGSRRELFVDHGLIESLRGAELRLATPVDAGVALPLDRPWEGAFCAYTTVIEDGGRFRMYYRGAPASGQDGNAGEVTCCAESSDGAHWTRPELRLFDVRGAAANNVVLAGEAPLSHNFSPFLDARPGAAPDERYKALAGVHKSGLYAFASADGLRWRKVSASPVVPSPKEFAFDSQNTAFWSVHENRYVLYYRTWKRIGAENYRWISRASSGDFLNWRTDGEMEFGGAPPEHLYTNQTSPYFRAPHIYTGICARFMPGRQVLDDAQAAAVGVDPKYYKDCSDAVLITSRGGTSYRRAFMEAFLRPGHGLANWVSRSNYPALNVVRTGAAAMSFFVNRNYGQASAHVRRYELRLDGFASAHAGYKGGEVLTRPLVFDGSRLELNFATSAAGSVRVELQDVSGRVLAESGELIGDETERVVRWRGGASAAAHAGAPVRLRFMLKDADVYAFRFGG